MLFGSTLNPQLSMRAPRRNGSQRVTVTVDNTLCGLPLGLQHLEQFEWMDWLEKQFKGMPIARRIVKDS